MRRGLLLISCLYTAQVAFSCGGTPELTKPPPEPPNVAGGGQTGEGGKPMGGRPAIEVPSGGDGGEFPMDGGRGSGIGCGLITCGSGQRCETDDGVSECVDNTCGDLACTELEECQPAPKSGHVCKSIRCDSDVECPLERHCDGEKCVDDACDPEARECSQNDLIQCAPNGSELLTPYTCKSAAYFESVCVDADPEAIGCTCEDDWDCPVFTECEVAFCQGSGVEPTCTIAPEPFENLLPEPEFRWGGQNEANPQAAGRAFPEHGQVSSTPIVINLDDDNGDGFVNELDFPELIFMSYVDNPAGQGVVRAVHGGGSNKGQDYFALCAKDHWFEGQPIKTVCSPPAGDMGRAAGGIAAGDLDGDGLPEIVFPLESGALRILNHQGEILTTSATGLWPNLNQDQWRYPQPAIANLDFEGLPEIVIGNRVLTLRVTAGALAIDRVFTGSLNEGTMLHGDRNGHHGPTSCAADLTPVHAGLEIVAGTTAYGLPAPMDCTGNPNTDYCRNRLTVVWDATAVNPSDPFNLVSAPFYKEGFCAVADVLGATSGMAPGPDNPLDGIPEVLVLADGELLILEAATGKRLERRALGGGRAGGAPNVDDFDGDGFPEVATALENFYTVVDLQAPTTPNCPAWTVLMGPSEASPGANPPRDPGGACTKDADCNAGAVCNVRAGACVCLHNSWRRDTEDDSSRVTSSSIFDFNGDGAAEVVYNDECYFRLYDGATGKPQLAIPSRSRTILENPVVADVDNDGNAEIIFVNNNDENDRCSELFLDSWPNGINDVDHASLPNGVEVWGDPSDQWVAARRIWNQHSYHVTNVIEGGGIPLREPESWKPLNGRLYNTYRAQPRNYGVAPDLALIGVQVSSPDAGCGELTDEIQISVLVKNEGDLRVGPGVVLAFGGVFEDPDQEGPLVDPNGDPIEVTLDKSLEPGATTRITVTYEAGNGGRPDLPVEVRVVIDPENRERECDEDDNEATGTVEPGEGLADLRVVLEEATCFEVSEVVIHNDGVLAATDVLVRVYAGDPSQGGTVLAETTIADPIEPGESATLKIPFRILDRNVTLYVVADPLNSVLECNDANNIDETGLKCSAVTR